MQSGKCVDEFSDYRDVVQFRYHPRYSGGVIENWYVDQDGQPTELYLYEDVPGLYRPFERYRCLVCGQRFNDWYEVLDHFVEPEDDEDGDMALCPA